MGVAMKQFIDRFKAMEKIANETLAENPEALVGVDSLPGSEHDAKVPEEAKKPNEEVLQGQPADAASTSGATNGGDAKPLNEGKLEVDEPLLNPEQKPLVTDDALTAKTANAHLESLVTDLLADMKKAPAKKQASSAKAPEAVSPKIKLDEETISKIAAAQAVFMMGREAASNVVKQAGDKSTADVARELIKAACIKDAQAQGLDAASAEAAANNAMAAAGMPPEAVAAADAGAADAAAADAGAAGADAAAAGADAADAAADALPDDVTEEELANAIVDLVSSGELDPGTAKALVEEIAGEEGAAAASDDQAAEIIAQGLESGEITPEQAQEIAAAVEGGGEAAAVDAEAQGAADAEAAAADAKDEAQGAADAEAAIKSAAAYLRQTAIGKVASRVAEKRAEQTAAAKPGDRIMSKVASILTAKNAERQKAQASRDDSAYIAGFKKKAEELGIDPSALAKYVCERQSK